jgi:ParB family chromosome partitioning protein
MEIVDLPVSSIIPAPRNPNEMDASMLAHLQCSIHRVDLVMPLVVRVTADSAYETIGGAQRLAVLKHLGVESAPCVIVQANDAEARLLGQALNQIAGTDNLGLRATVLREVLDSTPLDEVLRLLPEKGASLQRLTSIGPESITRALQQWEQVQKARLRHLVFRLMDQQLAIVEQALQHLLPLTHGLFEEPNKKGQALYLLCLGYLERETADNSSTFEEWPRVIYQLLAVPCVGPA